MRTLHLDNVHTATEAERRMQADEYFGFALGADSHHSSVTVTVLGRDYILTLGTILMLDGPVECSPSIRPLRRLSLQGNSAVTLTGNSSESRVQVHGFTRCQEMGFRPARHLAPISFRSVAASGPDASVISIPFTTRKMLTVSVDMTDRIQIFGGTNDGTILTGDVVPETTFRLPDREYLLYSALGTDADIIVQDVDYDSLIIKLGNGFGFANTLDVRVI